MDPFIGGALISGATSLLGGLFGRSSAKKDLAMQRQLINEQNEYNNPTNIRKRAEEGGFNPLSFIGPGVGLQTQTAQVNSGNYMGAAIADAGMAFAGAMADKAKFAETKKLNDLEMANAKLQNKILQLTLRPKVGGVYAQRETTPTIAAAVGGGNAADRSGSVVVAGAEPSSVSPAGLYDLDRPEQKRVNLYMQVYDPDTGRYIRVPDPDLMDIGPLDAAGGMATLGYYDAKQNVAPPALAATGGYLSNFGFGGGGYRALGERAKAAKTKSAKAPAYINPRWNNARPMFGGGY